MTITPSAQQPLGFGFQVPPNLGVNGAVGGNVGLKRKMRSKKKKKGVIPGDGLHDPTPATAIHNSSARANSYTVKTFSFPGSLGTAIT